MSRYNEIIRLSWLNNFLDTDKDLLYNFLYWKKYLIFQLKLWVNEISFIRKNYKKFIRILEEILFIYNRNSKNHFRNITFNSIKYWDLFFNNCIIFFSNNKLKPWYRHQNSFIKLHKINKKKEIDRYSEIEKLIIDRKLSIRNLIKIWIIQIRARKLYKFLKEKWVFEISKYNNNEKIYYLDNFLEIEKIEINQIIL